FTPNKYSKHLIPYTYQPIIVENPKKTTDIDTIYSPTIPSVEEKAALVKAPASKLASWVTPESKHTEGSQNTVTKSTKHVMLHTIIVTINVPVIATKACLAG